MSEHTNGAGVRNLTDEAAALLVERLGQVDAALAAFESLREEQRHLVAALRAIAPGHPRAAVAKVGRPRTPERGRGGRGAADHLRPDNLEAIWAIVRERTDGFTVPEVIEALEGRISHEPVRRGVIQLRNAEAIRLAGKGGKAGNADLYRLLDEDAGVRELERNAAAFKGRQ